VRPGRSAAATAPSPDRARTSPPSAGPACRHRKADHVAGQSLVVGRRSAGGTRRGAEPAHAQLGEDLRAGVQHQRLARLRPKDTSAPPGARMSSSAFGAWWPPAESRTRVTGAPRGQGAHLLLPVLGVGRHHPRRAAAATLSRRTRMITFRPRRRAMVSIRRPAAETTSTPALPSPTSPPPSTAEPPETRLRPRQTPLFEGRRGGAEISVQSTPTGAEVPAAAAAAAHYADLKRLARRPLTNRGSSHGCRAVRRGGAPLHRRRGTDQLAARRRRTRSRQ
jgi:hypothetical protein